jgi:hypothetical protein
LVFGDWVEREFDGFRAIYELLVCLTIKAAMSFEANGQHGYCHCRVIASFATEAFVRLTPETSDSGYCKLLGFL